MVGLGTARTSAVWLYPLASVVHILGLGLLVGAVAAFDLRVLGVARTLPIDALARLLLPMAALGLALQIASGSVLFAADATHLATNPLMLAKLAVIGIAALNLAAFYARHPHGWSDIATPIPQWAKITAAGSLAAWLLTACLGRLIAYV